MADAVSDTAIGIELSREWTYGSRKHPYRWRARLGPIDVVRPTQKEARDAIIDTVGAAISGDFRPKLMTHGKLVALVYRVLEGWEYQIGTAEFIATDGGGVRVSLGRSDRAEAILKARRHLAQEGYPESNGLDLLYEARDYDGAMDQAHWLSFCRAYEYATGGEERNRNGPDLPMTPEKAHPWACQEADFNPGRWLSGEEVTLRDMARAAKSFFRT